MWAELLLDGLAAFRLTRLVTTDSFPPVRHLRERLTAAHTDENGEPDALAELINCDWCAGMWVAAGVVAARRLAPHSWPAIARVLALSAVAGIAGSHYNED